MGWWRIVHLVITHSGMWDVSSDPRLRGWPKAESDTFLNHGMIIAGLIHPPTDFLKGSSSGPNTTTTHLFPPSPDSLQGDWGKVESSVFMGGCSSLPMGMWDYFSQERGGPKRLTHEVSGELAPVEVETQLPLGPPLQRGQRLWRVAAQGSSVQHSWGKLWETHTTFHTHNPMSWDFWIRLSCSVVLCKAKFQLLSNFLYKQHVGGFGFCGSCT